MGIKQERVLSEIVLDETLHDLRVKLMGEQIWSPDHYKYTDKWGAITQNQRDGGDDGDSAHRFGNLYFGLVMWWRLFGDIDYLIQRGLITKQTYYRFNELRNGKVPFLYLNYLDDEGYLTRNKKGIPRWTGDLDRGSRDQYTQFFCFIIFVLKLMKFPEFEREYLMAPFRLIRSRWGFFTNTRRNGATNENHKHQYGVDRKTGKPKRYNYKWKAPDFVTPKLVSIMLRVRPFGKWRNWWIRRLDWFLFLGSQSRNKKKDNDNSNHLSCVILANMIYPTKWSERALRELDYAKTISDLIRYWDIDGPEKGKDAWFIGVIWIMIFAEMRGRLKNEN
jgi:hypothetical protein